MSDAPDLIIANLDAETSWARRAGHGVRDLPARVLERISLYGTLLRVLWPTATRLWTPVPIQQGCLRAVLGLNDIELVSGALDPEDAAQAVSWAHAPPWNGPDEAIDAAMRVNHRRFAHDLAKRLGVALPGSGFVRSMDELLDRAVDLDRWVLKAPYGSAGRGFVHARGDAIREPDRRRIERLLDVHGEVLLEPWVDRLYDIGRTADAGYQNAQTHVLGTDARGRFEGILASPLVSSENPEETAALTSTSTAVAERLEDAGYDGPFGIDGYAYGSYADSAFNPLSEINARHTFGHVAHALRQHVVPRVWGKGEAHLQLGDEVQPSSDLVLPLVGSLDRRRMYAWLVAPQ